MKTVGNRIRTARKKNSLTLIDINNETGLSTGNLSELENDKFMPSANALILLKKVLNVSIDWILTGEDNPPYNPIYQQLYMECCATESEETCYTFSDEEKELIEGYRKLDLEKKNYIKGFIHICLANSDESNKDGPMKDGSN